MNDEELLNNYCYTRNLKPVTREQYQYSIRVYTKHQKATLTELINEAETEEDDRVRWKHSKLKQRLLEFRAYLYQEYMEDTAKGHMIRIMAIYRHYDIYIGELPRMNTRNVHKANPVTYEDLPTHEEIREAIRLSNPLMQSIILFMTSSGCARTETLNLTIHDFLTSTSEYHKSNNIPEALNEMKHHNNIIPVWNITRQKTNKKYTTFNSPEASNSIINYLLTRKELTPEAPLFKINKRYLNTKFQELNKLLGNEKAGTYNKFRSHNLRKWNATQLYNGENHLSLNQIDSLQGRSKNIVHEAYFKDNTQQLRTEYTKCLPNLMIDWQVTEVPNNEIEELKKQVANILGRLDREVELDLSDLEL